MLLSICLKQNQINETETNQSSIMIGSNRNLNTISVCFVVSDTYHNMRGWSLLLLVISYENLIIKFVISARGYNTKYTK